MALVLNLVKTSVSSDGNTLVLTDSTGNYDASTNTGGYGSPNETRANLYLKLFLNLKKSTGDEPITISAYNENTVTSWSITLSEDGYYEAYLFACRAWNSGTTYASGDIAYSSGQDKFYRSLSGSNLNHAVTDVNYWAEITSVDVQYCKDAIENTQANTYDDVVEWIELTHSRICKARMFLNADCCKSCGSCGNSKYDEIRYLIDGADIKGSIGAYSSAQKIVEDIQNKCNCIDGD